MRHDWLQNFYNYFNLFAIYLFLGGHDNNERRDPGGGEGGRDRLRDSGRARLRHLHQDAAEPACRVSFFIFFMFN